MPEGYESCHWDDVDFSEHVEISHPRFFADRLAHFNAAEGCGTIGIVLVPQEGRRNAGVPKSFHLPYIKNNSRNRNIDLALKDLLTGQFRQNIVDDICTSFNCHVENISGNFGVPIGFIWSDLCNDECRHNLSRLADRISSTIEKSKKSRLHEVVAKDFIVNRDTKALLESMASAVKSGLYCTEVIVWAREGLGFKSYGVSDWDLMASNSLVQKAHSGDIITVPSIDDFDSEIYYKEELRELGVKSFFLVPVMDEEKKSCICIVGVFYNRIGGTTNVDLELIHYVIDYFEVLWTMYQKTIIMGDKLAFFDDILEFHNDSVKCMVSFHEINSILHVLESEVRSALMLAKDGSQVHDHLSVCARKVDRANYLLGEHTETFATAGAINDSLDIPVGIRLRKVVLRDYVTSYLEGYAARASLEGVELTWSLPNSPTTLRVDLDHLDLVLDNFVTNALHALVHKTHVSKSINVALSIDGGRLRVEVADNGVGVPPWLIAHVFTINVTTRTNEGGRGLGLAIIWKLGKLHGKPPTVASNWGEGAVFSAWLDYSPAN